MAERSGIEWTDATWNPVTGCTKVSPGCARCYIERTFPFRREGRRFVAGSTDIRLHPERLEEPLRWRRPRRVFVNSLSDLFHEAVPDEFVDQVCAVMERASLHTFQVLTKRPVRAREYLSARYANGAAPPANVWVGVSIENARFTWRADVLRETPAAVRFVSAEPLLGSLLESGGGRRPLSLDGIDWVIVGGESGPGARPLDPAWVHELRDACAARGIAFFFKQWGGRTPRAGGRSLDGRTYGEFPRCSRKVMIVPSG